MSTEAIIKTKLEAGLSIEHLTIENESHMHSGPATDSHFKVTVVSEDFSGKRLVQRHQLIYGLLADEMKHPIHALSMHLFIQQEWQAKGETVMPSPKCLGGSKGEN
ncbi:BolA family protein [Neptuniibacter pectenicola]|jgi:BolA protein|uniref:BolA family protein n=1 Tax=Neptuniibacter pectenicola TaxID=1806669 RepID=UPI0008294ED9|nr:BolA family protein [Neptuniibacter pectenicola]|tara:strand:- start:2779 stop:3096 length:318 start_codon:yes stop_codon:yes gene_type:complete